MSDARPFRTAAVLLTLLGAATALAALPTRPTPLDFPETNSDAVTLDLSGTGVTRTKPGMFTGVISGPSQPSDSKAPDLTKRLQSIGVTSIRNNDYYDDRGDMEEIYNCGGTIYPSWEGCETSNDSSYNWTKTDTLMKGMKSGGFDVFFRLGGSWENKTKNHMQKGPANANQENNWIAAAKVVAKRYESQYTYLDIWTEYPGKHFWDRDEDAFNAFWIKAFKALKKEFPDKEVGGPGFGAGVGVQVLNGESKNQAKSLLGDLYEGGTAPDWIGWHNFSNDPKSYPKTANAYRDLLDGKGDYSGVKWAGSNFFSKTDLILDAFGPTDNPPQGEDPPSEEAMNKIFNGGRGAAIMMATFIGLQDTDTLMAYYYRSGDGTSGEGTSHDGGTGLFYGDASATPKPSAYAMGAWNNLRTNYSTVVGLQRANTSIPIFGIMGKSTKGYIILIANTTKESVSWKAKLPDGKSFSDFPTRSMAIIDTDNDGTKGTAWKLATGQVAPPQSVSVITLAN